jgi:hypothetical protein
MMSQPSCKRSIQILEEDRRQSHVVVVGENLRRGIARSTTHARPWRQLAGRQRGVRICWTLLEYVGFYETKACGINAYVDLGVLEVILGWRETTRLGVCCRRTRH